MDKKDAVSRLGWKILHTTIDRLVCAHPASCSLPPYMSAFLNFGYDPAFSSFLADGSESPGPSPSPGDFRLHFGNTNTDAVFDADGVYYARHQAEDAHRTFEETWNTHGHRFQSPSMSARPPSASARRAPERHSAVPSAVYDYEAAVRNASIIMAKEELALLLLVRRQRQNRLQILSRLRAEVDRAVAAQRVRAAEDMRELDALLAKNDRLREELCDLQLDQKARERDLRWEPYEAMSETMEAGGVWKAGNGYLENRSVLESPGEMQLAQPVPRPTAGQGTGLARTLADILGPPPNAQDFAALSPEASVYSVSSSPSPSSLPVAKASMDVFRTITCLSFDEDEVNQDRLEVENMRRAIFEPNGGPVKSKEAFDLENFDASWSPTLASPLVLDPPSSFPSFKHCTGTYRTRELAPDEAPLFSMLVPCDGAAVEDTESSILGEQPIFDAQTTTPPTPVLPRVQIGFNTQPAPRPAFSSSSFGSGSALSPHSAAMAYTQDALTHLYPVPGTPHFSLPEPFRPSPDELGAASGLVESAAEYLSAAPIVRFIALPLSSWTSAPLSISQGGDEKMRYSFLLNSPEPFSPAWSSEDLFDEDEEEEEEELLQVYG